MKVVVSTLESKKGWLREVPTSRIVGYQYCWFGLKNPDKNEEKLSDAVVERFFVVTIAHLLLLLLSSV